MDDFCDISSEEEADVIREYEEAPQTDFSDAPCDESDLSSVKERIETICGILSNWKSLFKLNKIKCKRESYINELKHLVTIYYGYSEELSEYFIKLFNPVEAIRFFDANDQPLPTTIRTNTLKTKRKELAISLINRGINVDPIGDWTKEGLVIHSSKVPIGATPEYLAGHYMLQSASSLIPVLALSPKQDEKILDIAAAPGGKTTHISQLMNNTGLVYANDINKDRCKSLVANIHRMGIKNTIVINYDGLKLLGVLPPLDRILCDAPCSGLGVISRDPSVKLKRSLNDIKENSVLQKKLICACVDMLKINGCMVYSTCSISIEENEEVIDYVLKMRDVKLASIEMEIGSPGISSFRGKNYHPTISKYTRRFYPHSHNLDGFFVAKLVKMSNKVTKRVKKYRNVENAVKRKKI